MTDPNDYSGRSFIFLGYNLKNINYLLFNILYRDQRSAAFFEANNWANLEAEFKLNFGFNSFRWYEIKDDIKSILGYVRLRALL